MNTSRPSRAFYVYVVELDGPDVSSIEPCVYVGETGLTPNQRFARHRAGGRTASRFVYRHGVRLRPDLSSGWGPYPTRSAAVAAESELAAALRAGGYRVCGSQGQTFTLDSKPGRSARDIQRTGEESVEEKRSCKRQMGALRADFQGVPPLPRERARFYSRS